MNGVEGDIKDQALKDDCTGACATCGFSALCFLKKSVDASKEVPPPIPEPNEDGRTGCTCKDKLKKEEDKFSEDANKLLSFIENATKELLELFPEAAGVPKGQTPVVSREEIKKWLEQMANPGELPSDTPEDAVPGPKPTGGSVPEKQIGSILQEAHSIINGERQDMYGSPEDSFHLIARYWSIYLGGRLTGYAELKPRDVAMMMALFKIARQQNKPKRDNVVDAAAYIALAGEL